MALIGSDTLAKTLATVLEDTRIGMNVHLANPTNATRPADGEFSTVLLAMTTPLGHPSKQYANESGGPDVVETYSQLSEIMFSVQVFRGATADRARQAVLALRQSWAREQMRTLGLAFTRVTDPRNITETKDASKESRFQFDVFYHTVESLEDTILSIESIDIGGTFFNGVEETPVNIEVRNQ